MKRWKNTSHRFQENKKNHQFSNGFRSSVNRPEKFLLRKGVQQFAGANRRLVIVFRKNVQWSWKKTCGQCILACPLTRSRMQAPHRSKNKFQLLSKDSFFSKQKQNSQECPGRQGGQIFTLLDRLLYVRAINVILLLYGRFFLTEKQRNSFRSNGLWS